MLQESLVAAYFRSSPSLAEPSTHEPFAHTPQRENTILRYFSPRLTAKGDDAIREGRSTGGAPNAPTEHTAPPVIMAINPGGLLNQIFRILAIGASIVGLIETQATLSTQRCATTEF